MVTNPFFDFGIVLILIANIIVMAVEHFPMTSTFEESLSVSALVSGKVYQQKCVTWDKSLASEV